MTRAIYAKLLQLHPVAFRDRFPAEMLAIFDRERRPFHSILDVTISLFRQWVLRPEFHFSPAPAPVHFQPLEFEPRHPIVFVYGALATILVYAGLNLAGRRGIPQAVDGRTHWVQGRRKLRGAHCGQGHSESSAGEWQSQLLTSRSTA